MKNIKLNNDMFDMTVYGVNLEFWSLFIFVNYSAT